MGHSEQHKSIRIERYGLESVPIEERTTSWYRYAFIQFTMSANTGNFLIPALAVMNGGLPFLTAVFYTSIGALLAFLFVSLLTLPGSKYGIPAQYAIRSILGGKGARLVSSPIRSITSLYWFSVQTIGGTYVLQQFLSRTTGNEIPFLFLSVPLAILMVTLATIGFQAFKQATTYFLPVLLLGELVMLSLYFTTEEPATSLLTSNPMLQREHIKVGLFYASLAFVQYVSGVSASADVTRYAVTPKQGAYGLFVGNALGFLMTAVLGSGAATLFNDVNPYVATSEQAAFLWLIGLITLTALLSMLSININNAYTGGYSLLNTFSSLSRVKSALIFGSLGVVLSSFPTIVTQAEYYIRLLGGLIVPLSAVIVVDFLVVKRASLSEGDFHVMTEGDTLFLSPFVTIGIGTLVYFSLPYEQSSGFIAFIVTAMSYYIATKLSSN
ncbi:cytosine permease [Pontibacillus halophilus JSM 076056 = DSM 19796]|uniref:Cytosine permease n=2 Tax=Pontibacillus TaxID=289201 RepID=A0A0A5GMY5_9BACI|nr:cytosine permease [Pontibacillus halophilus JSM 076056 = DSM 19796]